MVIELREGGVVACAEQAAPLFDTTVSENIRIGNPTARLEKIRSAAKMVGVDCPLDEPCGSFVPPAMAQRIGIARALLRVISARKPSASLLVLDDPLSWQDPKSTQHILASLQSLVRSGTTVVVITQHAAFCRAADTLLVMTAGRVKERGTHEELVSLGGLYFRLQQIAESFTRSHDGNVVKVRGPGLKNYFVFADLDDKECKIAAAMFLPKRYEQRIATSRQEFQYSLAPKQHIY